MDVQNNGINTRKPLFSDNIYPADQTLLLNNKPKVENQMTETAQHKPQGFSVPPSVEIKTLKNEDPKELHRRYLMEAASEAGLDGTDQQKEFVGLRDLKHISGVEMPNIGGLSPEDRHLPVTSNSVTATAVICGATTKPIF